MRDVTLNGHSSYLAILLVAARLAAAPASVAVSPMCDSAWVSGTVSSQATGLPLDHRINVLLLERFQFWRIKFTGSFVAGICARFTALHRISFIDICVFAASASFYNRRVHEVPMHRQAFHMCRCVVQSGHWTTANRKASSDIIILVRAIRVLAVVTD